MSDLVVVPPELESRGLSLPDQAAAIVVQDQPSLDRATEVLVAAVDYRRRVYELFSEPKRKQFEAHRAICNLETKMLAAAVRTESTLRPKIAGYLAEIERQKREEERRLQEEADERARAENLQAAIDAEGQGVSQQDVDAILNAPVNTPRVVAAPAAVAPKGISGRETWSAVVDSIKDLCRAVVDGKVPPQAVSGNMKYLDARARADKGLLAIPGVRAIMEQGVSVRR